MIDVAEVMMLKDGVSTRFAKTPGHFQRVFLNIGGIVTRVSLDKDSGRVEVETGHIEDRTGVDVSPFPAFAPGDRLTIQLEITK